MVRIYCEHYLRFNVCNLEIILVIKVKLLHLFKNTILSFNRFSSSRTCELVVLHSSTLSALDVHAIDSVVLMIEALSSFGLAGETNARAEQGGVIT